MGRPIVPVYVLDEQTVGIRRRGAASRWWLHHSLAALAASLNALGSRLVLRRGKADQVIEAVAAECDASTVCWNNAYDGSSREREARLKKALQRRGVVAEGFKANLLFEPQDVTTGSGGPFKVFTPFWKACRARSSPTAALVAPERLPAPTVWPDSDRLEDWRLLPTGPDWSGGLGAAWTPGEASAARRLATFVDEALDCYRGARDRPAAQATSRLSPHLVFGEISPRQVWQAVVSRDDSTAMEKFLSELGWREFAYHLHFHFGDLTQRNFRPEFDAFPWIEAKEALAAWHRGRTGYPIVDAGMRELWTTGWMHNRVRMIVASFLTKDLLIDWRCGERWFWDTLVDADAANNGTGWQWVAGCGPDAAPYFRVFNPVLQGEKFDPNGDYVRRWVPELASLPADVIHRPWMAKMPPSADVYPSPIIDHAAARSRALQAFRTLKPSR